MNRNRARGILVVGLVGGCYSPNTPVGSGDGGETTAGGSESSGGLDATTPTESSVSGTSADPTSATTATTSPTDPSDPSDTEADSTDGGPFCGDGVVDPDEVCDDGVNDSSYGSCTADCGGFGPRCGDDVIQGDEICDDGNDVDGDGCNTDCVESGTLLWSQRFVGVGDDTATGIATSAEGGIFVAGFASVTQPDSAWTRGLDGVGEEVWLEYHATAGDGVPGGVAVDGDGLVHVAGSDGQTLGWRVSYDPDGEIVFEDGLDDPVRDIAVSADGNVVTVGNVDYAGIVITRFGQDGSTLWTRFIENSGFDLGRGVGLDAEENVLAVGVRDQLAYTANGWLRKYTPNGSTEWTYVYNSSQYEVSPDGDNFQAVAAGPAGEVVAVGGSGDEPVMVGWIGSFSADGDVVWTDTYENPNGPTRAEDVAIDADGNVVVVGTVPSEDDGLTLAWVRKYTAAGVILWTREFNGDDVVAASTRVESIAIDAEQNILLAGALSTGADDDAWVGKVSP
jgi:cysteine-rich repeat protein